MPEKAHYIGHRKRLRERFAKSGADGLADYELIELLLFGALPRSDTKPLAKRLCDRFGSISAILAAEPRALAEVEGAGKAVIHSLKLAEAVSLRALRDQVVERPVIATWNSLLDYCKAKLAHQMNEQFNILFLDNNNSLIADETQQKGTVNHVPLYPREVIKRALELNASAIILVHNHPSGDPSPSPADIEMTEEVCEAGQKLGVTLHDHLIFSRTGHSSFKSMGLL
ncbi:MAG: DNA repair protein RadC [Rhodospirillaceae bacterium]|nr:DNA repair protein RadC [Rhodospirillaceae bacterium]MBT5677110.1 DNA repair protein RadC [Rhodospirillaceae bacterium]